LSSPSFQLLFLRQVLAVYLCLLGHRYTNIAIMSDKDTPPDSTNMQAEKVAPVEDGRRGSLRDTVWGDENKRKASIAALTQNQSGE
jgi:hypothetical protein